MVEQDAPSLKKNKNTTNFYEMSRQLYLREALVAASLLFCVRNRVLRNVEISHFVIKDIWGYVTKYVKWKGMV